MIQSEVPGANFDELALPAAVIVGDRTFNITNGVTTIALGDFDEGYLNVEDDAGEGRVYQIETHDFTSRKSRLAWTRTPAMPRCVVP